MGILKRLFGKKEKPNNKEEGIVKEEENFFHVPDENERMNWAIEKAGLTLHYFKDSLEKPRPDQQVFYLKARIEDGDDVEHMWLSSPSFDDEGNAYGVLDNQPMYVRNVTVGERIGVSVDKISDWMIVENGRLIGGYTFRAIRDGLDKSEVANFDQSLGGIYVDEGVDYFKPNFETPEAAIVALESAYDNDDLEGAIACKDFNREAKLMLSKTLSFDFDDELIEQTAEVLRLGFLKDMQGGMPKFNGLQRAYQRQKVTEDHYVITEICHFPDGGKSKEQLNVCKVDNDWKVMGVVYDEEK